LVNAAKLLISIALLVAAITLVALNFDTSGLLAGIGQLSILTLCGVLVALLANALTAALRLKIIARYIGHPLNFRQAMAAVSVGSLGGAAFFQIAGQLVARGVVMGRSGVPFASVAVMTVYERIVAAAISGLLALAGAYYIFGQVILDRYAGGDVLLKLVFGLIAAIAAGALVGHGRISAQAIATYLNRKVAVRFLSISGLSLLVQLPMMAAYVVAAYALSPQTPVMEIAAASAIVMFAASVPISLAGWGVREMSAVIALGAIGVAAGNALIAAIIVGAGSMLAMALMAALSLHGTMSGSRSGSSSRASIDYSRALAWTLPLAAATLVLFQIYVPMPSGTLLNVNLADPIAILAGALFVLNAVRQRRFPEWRFSRLNIAVGVATLVIAASLIHGAMVFGWTEWAVVNRFLGWFILLAFAMTGALIVKESGEQALHIFLLTYAGATAAVAVLEISMLTMQLAGIGLSVSISLFNLQGFSQNHNFFAFQLLMAIAATAVAARGPALRVTLFTLTIAGLVLCGSRSGWITLLLLLCACLYMRAAGVREIAIASAGAAVLTLIAAAPIFFTTHELASVTLTFVTSGQPIFVPNEANMAERILSMSGGLNMFLDNPIFGAGLGAFRNQMILATSGIPLLIHSTALWLLAEMGIVGLLVFSVPALYLLFSEARSANPDSASKLIVFSLVVFASMSAPADMLYQRTFWLLIGAALALVKVTGADEARRSMPDSARVRIP
jgi:uncharacterized membrane protein YbhN (UPF0104 family)